MDTSRLRRSIFKSPLIAVAWFATLAIIGGFVYLRFVSPWDSAVSVAQLVFLLGPLLASTFAAGAAVVAPWRSRAQLVWVLVALSATLLLASEAYYSWDLVYGDPALGDLGVADALNAAALVCMTVMMLLLTGLHRHGWRRILMMLADAFVLLVFGFSALYVVWVRGLGGMGSVGLVVHMNAYALAGLFMLSVDALVWLSMGSFRTATHTRLVVLAVAVYAAGMMLWPLWSLSAGGVRNYPGAEILSTTLWLTGYLLIFLAAMHRIDDVDGTWITRPVSLADSASPWPEVVISGIAMATVAWTARGALTAVEGSRDRYVHLGLLSLAVGSMVLRTALAAAYDDHVRSASVTDTLTGAANPRGFDQRMTEFLAASRRFGEGFVLIVLDLDDFGRINTSEGFAAGDDVLTSVAGALVKEFTGREYVFRLSGDEFAVIAPLHNGTTSQNVAERVRGVVRRIRVSGHDLDASVGYAICPDDALQRDALLRRADSALAWAKNHGKGQIIAYDSRVGRAADLDARLLAIEHDTRLGLIRSLSAAADARDPSNFFHSRNVAALAGLLAEDLGFEPEHTERIQIAALLHDVGNIALNDDVLGEGAHTTRQSIARREHCVLGAQMLESLGAAGISSWVAAHHERWDGHGFPTGMSGEAIPIEARILALADAYDAMMSGKRYGAPMSKSAALQEIDLGMGVRFDPVLAEKFITLVATTDAIGWSDKWSAA